MRNERSVESVTDDVDPSQSVILKARFGPYWRAWAWLRKQFTPASASILATLLIGCAGYIAHLRESVAQVRERVVVLETRVIPFVQDKDELGALKQIVDDHEGRLNRLESNWDAAEREAGKDPVPRKRGNR